MAARRSKVSRPSNARADCLLLLTSLLAFAAQAGEPAAAASLAPAPIASTAAEGDLAGPRGSDLYLDLSPNGNPQGLVHFGLRDGDLWASAATLRELGFLLPPDATDPVRLRS